VDTILELPLGLKSQSDFHIRWKCVSTTFPGLIKKCSFSKKSLDTPNSQISPKDCWNSLSRDKFTKSGNRGPGLHIFMQQYCHSVTEKY